MNILAIVISDLLSYYFNLDNYYEGLGVIVT